MTLLEREIKYGSSELYKNYKIFFSCIVSFSEFDGTLLVGKSVLCPFHNDKRHPSGKVYGDVLGETLYCFAERKGYKSLDYFNYVLHRQDDFNYLINKCGGELELRELFINFCANDLTLDTHSYGKELSINKEWTDVRELILSFIQGR